MFLIGVTREIRLIQSSLDPITLELHLNGGTQNMLMVNLKFNGTNVIQYYCRHLIVCLSQISNCSAVPSLISARCRDHF